jgi:mRNA-degrading endonuclease toxin of MazEF toxin-antitoxin module
MAVRRGEVYFVDFNPSMGREQAGRRPAVVISSDSVNQKRLVVMVVPVPAEPTFPPTTQPMFASPRARRIFPAKRCF